MMMAAALQPTDVEDRFQLQGQVSANVASELRTMPGRQVLQADDEAMDEEAPAGVAHASV